MSLRIDSRTSTALNLPEAAPASAPAAQPLQARDGFEIHRSTPDELITEGSSSQPVPQGDLQQGNTGPAVLQLQQDLVSLGFLSQSDMNTGPGIFGPHTLAAVKAFQGAHGVPTTGYFGPLTRAAMEAALSTQAPAPAPAPSGSTGVPPMDLKQGDSGPQVELLQNDLVKLGYMSAADMLTGPGIFGPHTLAAVEAFQRAYGVPSTGYYGPLTRAALGKALGGQAPNPQPPVGSGLSAPADIARNYLGRNVSDLKYNSDLDLDKWPGNTVCCANFVSACLEKAGEIPAGQHNDNVTGLVHNLEADGWREIPLSEAQPGDVVTFDGPEGPAQHVELFNAWANGRPQYIGSNNINADGTQRISYDTGSWAYSVHIYRHP